VCAVLLLDNDTKINVIYGKRYYFRLAPRVVYKCFGHEVADVIKNFSSQISMVAGDGYDADNGILFLCQFNEDISLMCLFITVTEMNNKVRQYNDNILFTTDVLKIQELARLHKLFIIKCVSYYYYNEN
jgi:hypothetical protein